MSGDCVRALYALLAGLFQMFPLDYVHTAGLNLLNAQG